MLETDELTWVDPDYLLQALGGNASAAAEMAADLMPCILPAIAALREASAHGDTRAAVLHCHSLRNSASLIGATALTVCWANTRRRRGPARRWRRLPSRRCRQPLKELANVCKPDWQVHWDSARACWSSTIAT
jgi:HPt (histidine-containing phosphotransfer) domain-containing protein